MRYVIDAEEFDGLNDITFDDIQACSDLDTLEIWYAVFEACIEDMRAQLLAYRLAGVEDLDWVRRCSQSLGMYGTGQTRLKQRMRALGRQPDSLGIQLQELQRKHQAATAAADYGRRFIDRAQALLSEEEVSRLHRETAAEQAAVADAKRAKIAAKQAVAA